MKTFIAAQIKSWRKASKNNQDLPKICCYYNGLKIVRGKFTIGEWLIEFSNYRVVVSRSELVASDFDYVYFATLGDILELLPYLKKEEQMSSFPYEFSFDQHLFEL